MEILELSKHDVGRWVVYTPSHGEPERGRIKFWNDKYVFVVYHCDNNWDDYQNYIAAATSPEDLCFIEEEDDEKEMCEQRD